MILHGRHVRPTSKDITRSGSLKLRRWSLISRRERTDDKHRQMMNVLDAIGHALGPLAGRYWMPRAQILAEALTALPNLAAVIEENPQGATPSAMERANKLMADLRNLIAELRNADKTAT